MLVSLLLPFLHQSNMEQVSINDFQPPSTLKMHFCFTKVDLFKVWLRLIGYMQFLMISLKSSLHVFVVHSAPCHCVLKGSGHWMLGRNAYAQADCFPFFWGSFAEVFIQCLLPLLL